MASGSVGRAASNAPAPFTVDPAKREARLARWQQSILSAAISRSCETAMGEEIVSPLLNGFHCWLLLTGSWRWLDRPTDRADAWVRRGVPGLDGYIGSPWVSAAGSR